MRCRVVWCGCAAGGQLLGAAWYGALMCAVGCGMPDCPHDCLDFKAGLGGLGGDATWWHRTPRHQLACLPHPGMHACPPSLRTLPIAARRLQVLMSGLEGELAAHLTRKLAQHGVASENIMFCDY